MEIRSGHFKRDARPPRRDAASLLRPLLVLFIVLFDWHFSYKQKRRGGEQKKKSPRRAVPPSASVRLLGVGVNGGGGDRLGQDQSLRPHFGIGVREGGREGKMRRRRRRLRLRSHLWLKIGTLLSGEASALSPHFPPSMPCVSHMSTFSLFILRLHPPIWSFTPIKPRDTVLSFLRDRGTKTHLTDRDRISYRSHFLVSPSSVALINLAVTKDSDKSPSSVSLSGGSCATAAPCSSSASSPPRFPAA